MAGCLAWSSPWVSQLVPGDSWEPGRCSTVGRNPDEQTEVQREVAHRHLALPGLALERGTGHEEALEMKGPCQRRCGAAWGQREPLHDLLSLRTVPRAVGSQVAWKTCFRGPSLLKMGQGSLDVIQSQTGGALCDTPFPGYLRRLFSFQSKVVLPQARHT